MLQLGHPVRFRFKTTYELRIIGEARQYGLDGHLPPDGWLNGPVDRAEHAFAYTFLQFITPQVFIDRSGFLHFPCQDSFLQGLRPRRRFNAQFPFQELTALLILGQGLAPTAVPG